MITNPKTFFEQFQNFIEESGLQLKKFKSSLSNYFTKSEAIDTFLGKTDQAESAKKADTATKATQDASGNVISSTYLTKANASSTYLTKTGKATSASTADTATKATQDASGNVITTTYATKTEVTSGLSGKLDKTAKATSAMSADSVAWTGVTGRPDPIPKTGDTGTISVMETIATASTVSDTSARSMTLANGGSLTVNDGSENKAWITVVALQGGATINLGSLWAWSGSAPTLSKGLVTLAWYGLFGVATFTKFGS